MQKCNLKKKIILKILSTFCTSNNDTEILTVDFENFAVSSIYKPSSTQFKFEKLDNFSNQEIYFGIGDFNNHIPAWGYKKKNNDGFLVQK